MLIEIKNYNCIKNLKYEIQDYKINYLIGNNGSGKSSIAKAISNDDISSHIPYYDQKLIPEVKINGKSDFDKGCFVFDDDYMRNILISKSSLEEIYAILVDDESNLESLRADYENTIISLENIKDKLFEIKRNIDTLEKDLNIAYKTNGSYNSKCIIKKMEDNVNNHNQSYIKYKKYDSKRIKWFDDGTKYDEYLNGKCPFCNKKISANRKDIIEKILVFDAKSYNKINSMDNIFKALKIEQPDWVKKKEVSRFNNQIKEHIEIKEEIEAAIQYIIGVMDTDLVFSKKIEKLKISSTLKRMYPEIAEAFLEFNSQYSKIRSALGKIKASTDKLINNNVKRINSQLKLLGIDYRFIKTKVNEEEKKAEYIIIHNNDEKEDEDRVNGLSYGERNLIGLVLFLCAHKKDKMVIIDDPASSFDEYRRKALFDMFYDFKTNDTTMLIISHDPLFAKFALIYDKDNNKYTKNNGNISLLENYQEEVIKPISKEDFGSLNEFIRGRVTELNPDKMTYQLAANLRLFYEIERKNKYHNCIYGYLSMIIHLDSKELILDKIREYGTSEQDLLQVISKEFDFDHIIGNLDNNYCEDINYSNLNNVEKIVFARESCKSKVSRAIRAELGNIIHLNNAYLICLNPYKFNYFSKFVYDYITNLESNNN